MLRFVDVSNNNGPHVDFAAVKRAGAVGVYLKVSEGTSFLDPDYTANYARAKAAGLRVGGYHFGHPKNPALAEIEFFLAHLQLEKGDLKPALDLEVTDGQNSLRVHAYAAGFLDRLRARIGARGVLYSGEYFEKQNGLAGRPELHWVADYGAHPVLHYDAWQYTDGQKKYGPPIANLDTSYMTSLPLFVYGASPAARAAAVAKQKAARARVRVWLALNNLVALFSRLRKFAQ